MTEEPSPEKRFVVDVMLGKVAKWLRILGFDARCLRVDTPEQVARFLVEGRLIVTKRRRWGGSAGVFCLKSNDPVEQLRELIAAVPIDFEEFKPLRRCIRCNLHLDVLSRDQAFGRVPDYVFETNERFHHCPGCGRVYWPGSHLMRMVERMQRELNWSG
jgi:uncharacterized protein